MEAAAQQVPQGAEQKLKIDKFADGQIICLKFSGAIDEDFEGKKLAATVKAQTLILDLADVKKISSFGIREWVDFMNAIAKQAESIILLECSPKVVDQLNMVANFAGTGQVFSFYAPYRCDYCDSDSSVLMQVDRDWEVIKSMKPPERPCASCGEPEYFDEDPTTYFSYIVTQGTLELDPEVGAFLSAKLNYTVSESARRLRIDKIIEGRSTYIKLAGDLDGSFPREKLAEGMEGTIIVDVTGVGMIDPAGAAEWRGFLQMVTPAAEAIYLLGVPPAFLEKLTKPEDLGPKAQVIAFAMPYSCSKCATTSSQFVDVEEHFDVLKFATPPEMKCSDCKSPTVCAAGENLLSHLPTLPKPSITPQTRKFIKDIKERKPEKKRPAAGAAGAQGGDVIVRSGPTATTVLAAAAIAGALAAGGIIGYKFLQEKNKTENRDIVGKLVEQSAEARPGWITSDARFSAYCNNLPGEAMSCVGVSSYAATEEDAREEAKDAALEAMANAIGLRITDRDWQVNVASVFGESRQLKLAAFDKLAKDPDDSKYERARRDVLEGRKAVAASLKKTGAGAVPSAPANQYWERFESPGGEGFKYLIFVEYAVAADSVKRLVDTYSMKHEALGATAVTVFPGIGWRYPDVETGAAIIKLDMGDLKSIGLAEEYVVLEVQNRQIKDAATFARVVTDEVTRLKAEGGNIDMMVKTGDTAPRKFNTPVQRAVTDRPSSSGGSGRPSGSSGGTRPTGSVNTWDLTAPGNRGGRDDPTQ